MKHMRMATLAMTFLASLAILGCGGGSSSDSTVVPATRTLQWNLAGLETLGPGFEYEGWIIVGGAPVSTGRFNVDGAGVPSQTSATISEADALAATTFVLSIEPMPDPDPAPSSTKILGGDFAGGQATLGVGHAAALGDDFSGAVGRYILAAPSDPGGGTDTQGIWWVIPAGETDPALALPTLPAGWAYEGWIVTGTGPVSTGRFTDPNAADSDGAGPAAGASPGSAPAVPGQDFINPATDLVGLAAVISVEPEPDDSTAPFAMKPLLMSTITPDTAPIRQDMMNNAGATNPMGTATIN